MRSHQHEADGGVAKVPSVARPQHLKSYEADTLGR